MAETFYGPWQVRVPYIDTHQSECLFIAGSDNADDTYIPPFPGGTTIVVTGDQWHMGIKILEFGGGAPRWIEAPVRRVTEFSAQSGFSVTLERSEHRRVQAFGTSMNPLLNPGPIPDPYDFSLPRDF